MLPEPTATWATRLQLAGIALALGAMAALLLDGTLRSAAISWVHQGGTPWISAPVVPQSRSIGRPRGEVPATTFARTFRVEGPDTELLLRVRALRSFELQVNDRVLASRGWDDAAAPGSWKRAVEVQVGPALRPGENTIRVRVRNPIGPPLLQVAAEATWAPTTDRGGGDSDSDWSVDGEGGSGLAVVADDTRPDPQVFATPRLGERLAAHSTMLLGVFALGCLVSLGMRSAPAALRARLALGLWPALAGFWVALFVRRALALPAYMGFDGPQHLEYVRFVIEQGALPLASDGGMMYHPPLFYVLSAGLVQLFGSGGDVAALRIASTLPGLAQIAIAFGLARRLFPDDRALARVAAVCAGLLPMNLYMSCYLSNEPLHAALAGLAIWATVGLLLRDGLPWPGLVAVGALLAGAILSKATSLLLLPLVLGFLAWKSDFADRSPAPRSALALAGLVAVVGGLAGWYFVRNQLVFGQAVVGNWNVPGIERVWWQYPGFHTASYYLRFGDVLARPFLVGFSSFFDGIYSTFWGDGLIGGIAAWRDRHPLWNYDAMSLVYVLAVPATAIGIYGFASLVREALSGDDVRRRIALTFIAAVPFATGFVVLYLTLVHPAFGMTKAFYALSVTGCLAVSAARGALLLRRRLAASRWPGLVVPLDAWAVTLIAFIGASFLG